MNITEPSSAEKSRERNIRKNREFELQIGFTSLVENRLASQEKIINSAYRGVEARNFKLLSKQLHCT